MFKLNDRQWHFKMCVFQHRVNLEVERDYHRADCSSLGKKILKLTIIIIFITFSWNDAVLRSSHLEHKADVWHRVYS